MASILQMIAPENRYGPCTIFVTIYQGHPRLRREGFYFAWGCVKRFFLALRAKLNLDGDIFFLILRSKIRKKMSPSKEYFAAVGGKILFTQLHAKYYFSGAMTG